MATFSLSFLVIRFKRAYLDAWRGLEQTLYMRDRDWRSRDMNYPLYIARTVSNYLQEYCNTTIPVPKMDMVTIPDLDVEGLGQWGLSSFR